MKSRVTPLLLFAFTMFLFPACSSSSSEEGALQSAGKKADEALSRAGDTARESAQATAERLRAELDTLDGRIQELHSRLKSGTRTVSEKTVQELEKERAALQAKVHQLSQQTGEAWESTRSDVETSLQELQHRVGRAFDALKGNDS